MITVRRSEERRRLKRGTHDTWMTFDPENRVDPLRDGFRALVSLNEENLAPGMGLHSPVQQNVDIITYVHEGTLNLQNEVGELVHLGTGEFQQSSGSGAIHHRAFNGLFSDDAHIYRSCFTPGAAQAGGTQETKRFPTADREGVLRLVVSPDGEKTSLRIGQDVRLYSSVLLLGHHLIHEPTPGRGVWLHVVRGSLALRGLRMGAGDGAAFDGEAAVSFTAQGPAEILLFDLA